MAGSVTMTEFRRVLRMENVWTGNVHPSVVHESDAPALYLISPTQRADRSKLDHGAFRGSVMDTLTTIDEGFQHQILFFTC